MKKQRTSKKKEKSFNLSQIFILFVLGACLVGFTLNMGFFAFFKTAQPGSLVVVDYTLRDGEGVPVLTSQQTVFEEYYAQGIMVPLSQPIALEAGATLETAITPVDLIYPQGMQFALFSTELDAIAAELVGVHANDRTTVPLDFGLSIQKSMTAEEFGNIGFDFDAAAVGDRVPLGLSTSPVIPVDNTTPEIPLRFATITEKNAANLTVTYGYASADIVVQDIKS